ncbi:uncharacterized protein LOC111023470 isoform X3 [Momordica charantia]|uniref:Uncharacterized protein LOC111023470 isoform X3 n=1 Tax=Momordica charantia TaxID=3673 RepID=A0A6J1DTY5_MOMCH|nr:uncharacterized protein LOC111023470 isoform X3 [Momordica charantia]
METHKDLQEFQNHHTNPKTTGFEVESNISFRESWPQIQALLRQLIHKEVEKEVERKIHALFPSLPSSPRCFASPKEAIVGLGTVKEFEAEFSDIMDLNKHYLVENDAMEGGANEENVEIDEKTSQI